MPHDYKHIKKQAPESLPARFSNGLAFLMGLALGIFIAVIIYFKEHNATININQEISSPKPNIALNESELEPEENTELLEPEFAFYKILPDKKFNISEWESIETEDDDKATNEPVMFVLQVGSFKQFDDAEQVKAKLALIGVTANIQRVVINGHDVRHRVRVGPYKNKENLKQTKGRLLENNLDFTLLELKSEDL